MTQEHHGNGEEEARRPGSGVVLEAKGGSTFSDEEVVKIKPERALCT